MKRSGLIFGKKGSHVGVVISFMIFVTFLLFIQIILEPALNISKEKQSLVDSVERNVINRSSDIVKSVTISVNSVITSTCVSVGSFFSDFDFDSKILVTSEEGNPISSSISSSSADTLQIKRNSNSETLLKVRNSNSFDLIDTDSTSCQALNEGIDYTLGITNSEVYVIESKILKTIEDYSNYSQLKRALNIPNGTDIGLGFTYENGSTINTPEKNITTNIYVSEKQIDYVNNFGKISSGKLKVIIW